MLPPLLDATAESPRDKWLWAFIGLLVVGQMVAFWMLCQNQVSQAQARHAALHAESYAQTQQFAKAGARADSRSANTLLVGDAGVRQRTAFRAD